MTSLCIALAKTLRWKVTCAILMTFHGSERQNLPRRHGDTEVGKDSQWARGCPAWGWSRACPEQLSEAKEPNGHSCLRLEFAKGRDLAPAGDRKGRQLACLPD